MLCTYKNPDKSLQKVSIVSIGICCYNEEKNIGHLLKSLISQKTVFSKIKEIIIVSSSTDKTNEIVKKYQKIDRRIKLIIEMKRGGKAAAINLFLKHAIGEIIVFQSADTIPMEDTIDKIVKPFLNSRVGMTAAKVVPTNNPHSFMGFISHLLWKTHDEVSKMNPTNPKMGELIAFRLDVVREIPRHTLTDEAWIESMVKRRGLFCQYVPEAIVFNYGPETILDFIKQREKIIIGHLNLKNRTGYEPPTMNLRSLLRVLPRVISFQRREFFFTLCAMFLEFYVRLLGFYRYTKGENPYIWDIARTTKEIRI